MAREGMSAAEALAIRRAQRERRRGADVITRGGSGMGAIFNVFPLILVPVLIYNILAFGSTVAGTTGRDVRANLNNEWFSVPMASREAGVAGVLQPVEWTVTSGDMMVLIALILLFIE